MSDAEQQPNYVEYAMTVDAQRSDEAVARLQGRGIEYVWVDAPIETFVIEDGYDYREADVERLTVRAYEEVADDLTPERLEELRKAVADWMDGLAAEVTAQVPPPVTPDPVYEFTAIEVKPGLVIRPPWDEERGEGETTLLIEPSAAFGTGLHPTTRHCVELIDDLVLPGHAVADLGAGSGILSIMARKKGAERVVAVDLNPAAESTIAYHMELNGVSGVEVVIGDVHEVFSGQYDRYDLVAVNIGGKEAILLADLCARIVKPEGTLLLSGIVEWIEGDVQAEYEALGYRVFGRRQGDEWVTLALMKKFERE
jgi:ribosomal protein L11 methyltransferase